MTRAGGTAGWGTCAALALLWSVPVAGAGTVPRTGATAVAVRQDASAAHALDRDVFDFALAACLKPLASEPLAAEADELTKSVVERSHGDPAAWQAFANVIGAVATASSTATLIGDRAVGARDAPLSYCLGVVRAGPAQRAIAAAMRRFKAAYARRG